MEDREMQRPARQLSAIAAYYFSGHLMRSEGEGEQRRREVIRSDGARRKVKFYSGPGR